jgi:hypoxanthine phosphoribosyltransferase
MSHHAPRVQIKLIGPMNHFFIGSMNKQQIASIFGRPPVSASSAPHPSEFNNSNLEPLLTAEQIQTRIGELGAQIARDYAGRNPLLLGVLKGAFIFLSDLMRAIDLKLGVEFMAISSYGASTRSSGEVKIVKDLDVAIEGRDIIVAEDIVDTGLTLSYLMANLRSRGAASVKLVALLNKQERRLRAVEIDYLGFDIPDAFVVGYGLDFAERYRNLPYIAVIKDPTQG